MDRRWKAGVFALLLGLLVSGQSVAAAVLMPGTIVLSGSWSNLTFGSTGSLDIIATLNPDATADVIVDLGGNVFGIADPAPITLSGGIDPVTGAISVGLANDAFFGDVNASIDPTSGGLIGSAINIPGSIDHLNFGGLIGSTSGGLATINGIYSVFNDPNPSMPFAFGSFQATEVVPVPAAIWLMVSGMAAVGFAGRRRRA